MQQVQNNISQWIAANPTWAGLIIGVIVIVGAILVYRSLDP